MASSCIRRARPRTRRPASPTSSMSTACWRAWKKSACGCWCMASRRRATSMCSIAKRTSSTPCWRRCSNDFPRCRWYSSTSRRRARSNSSRSARSGVAATITPQHLLHNRNAIFSGGIRPHYYCLPILKREQRPAGACLRAATSGNPRYFLGTDSAPHERGTKETACGCAGMFTAHAAIELYAEAFESVGQARSAGRLCQSLRRRFLWPAASRRHDYLDQGTLDRAAAVPVR